MTRTRLFFHGKRQQQDSDLATPEQGLRCLIRTSLKAAYRRTFGQLATPRSWLLAGMHLIVFVAAYWAAFLLRFGFHVPADYVAIYLASLTWVVGIQLAIFCVLGLFHGWWRYVTFADFAALVYASFISLCALTMATYFIQPTYLIPRGVLGINFMLIIGMLGALRASWRMFREVFQPMLNGGDCRWALLVGTDLSNGILAHQIQSHFHLPYRVRGFLTVDDHPIGGRLGQIPILGKLEDVREIAAAYHATDVLVVAGTLPGARLRDLMENCELSELNLKIIRPVADRLEGDSRVPIRDIEINDLLRRDPVTLDTENIGKPARRAARVGDRRRRQHRFGNLPPGARIQSGIAGAARARRESHLHHRTGTA